MSVSEPPRPPDDLELRNIIDKLAQFVARNGPEFENMTKQKQKDNPRFHFLFGGEFFHYYMYKVNTEQAIMRKQKNQVEQNSLAQIQVLQQQIHESEKNLKLQYDVLIQQQQVQIEEALRLAEQDRLNHLSEEYKINLVEFASVLLHMQESCTKEAISAAKNWFFNHYSSQKHGEIILQYLVCRVKEKNTAFLFKLHLLYLINDLTHHYMRKQNDAMLQVLGRFVIIMYACVFILHSQDELQKEKLEKLRSIWESQKYFDDEILKKLSNVNDTYDAYQENLKKDYSHVITEVTSRTQNQYHQFELQHLEYAKHVQQQIIMLENLASGQNAATFQNSQQSASMHSSFMASINQPLGSADSGSPSTAVPQRRSRFDAGPPTSQPPPTDQNSPMNQQNLGGNSGQLMRPSYPMMSPGGPGRPPPNMSGSPSQMPPWHQGGPQSYPPRGHMHPQGMPPGMPPRHRYDYPPYMLPNQHQGMPPRMQPGMNAGHQPQPLFPPSSMGPSRFAGNNTWNGPAGPPPSSGWPQNVPQMRQPGPPRSMMHDDINLVPKVCYYDLPAGLMLPLVKLEDHEYKPLDATKIRLPPPMPPNERLLAAVEAFYSPPSHDSPRDSDGWERLGLYEYFKAKQDAIKFAENNKDNEKTGPPSEDDDLNKNKEEKNSLDRQKSPSSENRSRSRTSSSRSKSRSRSGSRSRHSRSRSESSRSRSKSRSRSYSRSPEPRSPVHKMDSRGTEVNDRSSIYQGLGADSNVDPFEDFRKARSGAFLQRIRAAAEKR